MSTDQPKSTDPKKGDVLRESIIIPAGQCLWHNFKTEADAIAQIPNAGIPAHDLKASPDPLNPGSWGLVVVREIIEHHEWTVAWRVDSTVGLLSSSGDNRVLDLNSLKAAAYTIAQASPIPEYQSAVALLSDSELEESIRQMRSKRLQTPPKPKSKPGAKPGAKPKIVFHGAEKISSKTQMTPEQASLQERLSKLSPADQLEILRKAGLA
jgi:hypothetical protein